MFYTTFQLLAVRKPHVESPKELYRKDTTDHNDRIYIVQVNSAWRNVPAGSLAPLGEAAAGEGPLGQFEVPLWQCILALGLGLGQLL